jgi:hypothetical protein
MAIMKFEFVWRLGNWEPIRECPGRFVLRGMSPVFSLYDLLADNTDSHRLHSPKARDTVCIVCLEDGGIISYHRSDGTWLHTLNTREGFARKLKQLEISLSD